MPRTIRLCLPLLAASVLVGAGCGSDDDGDGGSSEAAAPTKAEYIAQADQVCRDARAELARLAADQARVRAEQGGAASAEEGARAASKVADVLNAIVASRGEVTADLQALQAPDGQSPSAYLQAREAADQALSEEAAALEKYAANPNQANTDAASEANQASVEAGEEPAPAAAAYGFKVCGRPIG